MHTITFLKALVGVNCKARSKTAAQINFLVFCILEIVWLHSLHSFSKNNIVN